MKNRLFFSLWALLLPTTLIAGFNIPTELSHHRKISRVSSAPIQITTESIVANVLYALGSRCWWLDVTIDFQGSSKPDLEKVFEIAFKSGS